MRSNYLKVYMHFVWATWDRQPIIDPHRQTVIIQSIRNEASRWKVKIHALGGVDNHIHLLIQLPSTIGYGQLVNQLKGKSSKLCGPAFRWQRTYAAISVSKRDVAMVVKYIENQEQHHALGPLLSSLEITESGRAGESFCSLEPRLQAQGLQTSGAGLP